MTRKHDHKIQITQTVDEQQRIGAKVEDLIEGAESILKHEQYYRSDREPAHYHWLKQRSRAEYEWPLFPK
jgi:hypothetical protein